MNFRGTDFLEVPKFVDTVEYWIDAKKRIDKSKFLVITDDIDNAKLKIVADEYINPNYKVALKLLTESESLIIPGWTTFAWWGAWLSNANIIIAPDVDDICYIKNDVFTYVEDRGKKII